MDPTLSCEPLLPALIETYLARCAVEGKSPRTIAAYRESLARFSRCLREDGAPLDPDRIRPDHVIAYLVRFAALSPDTRHRYFREVRCFCTWLRVAGYTDNDPFPWPPQCPPAPQSRAAAGLTVPTRSFSPHTIRSSCRQRRPHRASISRQRADPAARAVGRAGCRRRMPRASSAHSPAQYRRGPTPGACSSSCPASARAPA